MSEDPVFPLHRIIEAILFASQKPVSQKELLSFFKGAAEAAKESPDVQAYAKLKADQILEAIQVLEREYTESGRAFEVRESAAGWQLVTRADFAPWLRQLFPENRSAKLSAPALETLAIIAYRQPITRALLDRGLVRIAGRAEIAGRPLLYETTQFFMEHFGLKDLDDLPNAGELRRIPLPQAAPPEAPAAPTTEGTSAPEPENAPELPVNETPAPDILPETSPREPTAAEEPKEP